MHLVHTAHSRSHRLWITNIGVNELDVLRYVIETTTSAARIIVKNADSFANMHQRFDQGGSDKPASASDKNPCH